MLNLRHAHGAQRKLLQVRQLREHKRMLLDLDSAAGRFLDSLRQHNRNA